MLLKQGVAGLILVVVFQIILIFKITPFADYYFPFIWFGYIFLVDAIVFHLQKSSLIQNHTNHFFIMLILSAFFWWIFEWINFIEVNNWRYINPTITNIWISLIFRTIAFSTVLPAIWVTYDLIKALHLFDRYEIPIKYDIRKQFLYGTIFLGVLCFFLPFIIPTFAFPLIWLSFFLIFDPINYIQQTPSIIAHLANGKLKIPLSLMFAGLICGIFWEFWNYWAPVKWVYHIPYLDFIKIFEMPLLGYFGYFFFAWEMYAMYHFCMRLIDKHIEKNPI